MGSIITFDLGSTGPGSYLIQQMYEQYSATPPAGYSVQAHKNINDLCSQVGGLGTSMDTVEVIAHGNPYYLGQILLTNVQQLARALHNAPISSKFYFSGCNTGTWNSQPPQPQQNTFCIAAYLASMTPCQVYGTRGYVDTGTWAMNNITCSATDWGQSAQYGNSLSSTTPGVVFQQKPRATMPQYMIPNWTPDPIALSSLSAQMQQLVNVLLAPLSNTPPQPNKLNPRTAANVRIAMNDDVYAFYGSGGNTVMQESTSSTWRIAMSFAQQQQLMSLWNPLVYGAAVVAAPEAAPTESPKR